MNKMDCSFAERESTIDLGDIIADFANADEDNSARIPVKKLADIFDTCATKAASEDGMRVYLRVRPTSKPESTIFVESEQTIVTNAPDSSKRALYTKTESRHYMFTRVFDAHCDQTEVFDHVAQPLLQRFLNGENSVVFAYGMTNAGKTHTIQGTSHHPGLLPRLVAKVLDHVGMNHGWELHVSMLEVYQDNIYDLLGKKREKLSIRDGSGKVEVAKLSTHPIGTTQDSFRLMDLAAAKRTKSSTFLNTGSSRSHAVYTLTLTRPTDCGRDIMSTAFQLVDLAGAERSNRTKATLIQQKEANNINTSLMQLWRCLHAVKRKNNQDLNGSMEIIPFRESKLTHLLMPILGRAGLSGVAMIACVNPQIDDYDETLTILGNASLASKIREFQDVGRVAAQQVPASVLAAQQQKEKEKEAAAAAAAAAAANAHHHAAAPKGIRLEDLKDYRDKHSNGPTSLSSTTGNKRKRTDSSSATSTAHGKRVLPNTKSVALGNGLTSGANSTRNSVAETVVSLASVSHDDHDNEQERKRLRKEIQNLRDLNEQLVQQTVLREADIRREVSEEMMTRSSHLLQQIQDLRRQLDANENSQLNDVTKSVRKAKRTHQQMQAEEDLQQALEEAEAELERVKAEHEIEVYKLRSENFRLREELARYKPMSVVQSSVANKTGNRSPTRSPNRSPLSPINSAKNSPVAHHNNLHNIQSASAQQHELVKKPLTGGAGGAGFHPQPVIFDVSNQENQGMLGNVGGLVHAQNSSATKQQLQQQNLQNLSPQQRLRNMKANGHYNNMNASNENCGVTAGTGASGNGYFTRLRSQFTRA